MYRPADQSTTVRTCSDLGISGSDQIGVLSAASAVTDGTFDPHAILDMTSLRGCLRNIPACGSMEMN
jgi:hypothetical protein